MSPPAARGQFSRAERLARCRNSFKNEAKHGISRETVEAFFGRDVRVAPDPKHSRTEDRFLALGRSPGERPMIVAFTVRAARGLKLIRPISARFMHAREIAARTIRDDKTSAFAGVTNRYTP